MITLLIRCSYRPIGFKRTLESIQTQSFKDWKIICSFDDERALTYIPSDIERVQVFKSDKQFFFDDYVNTLKDLVTEGYFGVIDEGDVLASPNALRDLWWHLKSCVGVICQFSRGGRIKPKNDLIKSRSVVRGKIGMPCLFLHHSYKNVADLDGSVGAADYTWIKRVSRKVRLKFVPVVVIYCEKRDNGAIEV